jgi:hypothetical protein
MREGKAVTFELDTDMALFPWVTTLRRQYPDRFCALIQVELPLPDLKAYAVRITPTTVFTDNIHETGVRTLRDTTFEIGKTEWIEYSDDVDGSEKGYSDTIHGPVIVPSSSKRQ